MSGMEHTEPTGDNAEAQLRPARPMRQSRITQFFPLSNLGLATRSLLPEKEQLDQVTHKRPHVSFLTLPRTIRERVYDYARVPTGKVLHLNKRSRDKSFWEESDSSDFELYEDNFYRDSKDAFPLALLRASRAVRDEVEERLYSKNRVHVALGLPEGLHPLERLSNNAIKHLKVLIVGLLPCKCLQSSCSERSPPDNPFSDSFEAWQFKPSSSHIRCLDCISRRDRDILAQWKRICVRLAANVQPHRLELYFMAEVANVQVAKTILDPLRDLPILKEAAISLLNSREDELRALAREAALQLMETPPGFQPHFPFLHLPPELQLQILGFTRLVSQSTMTWYSSDTLADQSRPWCGASDLRDAGVSVMDPSLFCCRQEAAYRSQCNCAFKPSDLFRVSKLFGAAARTTFYSQNHFMVLPSIFYPLREWAADADDAEDGYKFITIFSFLKQMPYAGIRSLSHVTIILPPCSSTFLLPEQKASDRWLEAVDLLRQHANLPGLKLEIHFADRDVMPLEDLRARRTRNKSMEREMYEMYVRILTPLKKLVGLRALLIYVAWPTPESAASDRKEDERKLEKMVMGEGFDSAKWGKQERSVWSQPDRFWWTQYH
ncbi:hypothetical protein GQ53DRAFT_507755 [Thozetella sp. PMI_491]|nr:hypothetical protein GQ53DRAFT_507755 [Thozetella sp. PMI_491]